MFAVLVRRLHPSAVTVYASREVIFVYGPTAATLKTE